MTTNINYSNFITKPEDAESSGFPELDYAITYKLKAESVSQKTSPTSGNDYIQVVWGFVDSAYGAMKVYDIYPLTVKFRIAMLENIYRNWGLDNMNGLVTGKIVDAKLKKEAFNGKDVLKVESIKQWKYKKKDQDSSFNLEDKMPF